MFWAGTNSSCSQCCYECKETSDWRLLLLNTLLMKTAQFSLKIPIKHMNKVWTFPLPRSSLTEQGRLFLRLNVSMDDKQIFRGVTGDRKEEDDEIPTSQYSQTVASESDAEAADRTGTFNRSMWRTLQWEMEQRCLIFQGLLLKSTVCQNTFPLRTWNCLQLKSLWL